MLHHIQKQGRAQPVCWVPFRAAELRQLNLKEIRLIGGQNAGICASKAILKDITENDQANHQSKKGE